MGPPEPVGSAPPSVVGGGPEAPQPSASSTPVPPEGGADTLPEEEEAQGQIKIGNLISAISHIKDPQIKKMLLATATHTQLEEEKKALGETQQGEAGGTAAPQAPPTDTDDATDSAQAEEPQSKENFLDKCCNFFGGCIDGATNKLKDPKIQKNILNVSCGLAALVGVGAFFALCVVVYKNKKHTEKKQEIGNKLADFHARLVKNMEDKESIRSVARLLQKLAQEILE